MRSQCNDFVHCSQRRTQLDVKLMSFEHEDKDVRFCFYITHSDKREALTRYAFITIRVCHFISRAATTS